MEMGSVVVSGMQECLCLGVVEWGMGQWVWGLRKWYGELGMASYGMASDDVTCSHLLRLLLGSVDA